MSEEIKESFKNALASNDLQGHEGTFSLDTTQYQRDRTTLVKAATLYLKGDTAKDMSKQLGMSIETVRKLRTTEEFKEIVNELNMGLITDSKNYLKAMSVKATETIASMLESNSDKIRLSAAQDILNRTGVKQADTLNIVAKNDTTANMSEDELKEIIKLGVDEILGEKIYEQPAGDSESEN